MCYVAVCESPMGSSRKKKIANWLNQTLEAELQKKKKMKTEVRGRTQGWYQDQMILLIFFPRMLCKLSWQMTKIQKETVDKDPQMSRGQSTPMGRWDSSCVSMWIPSFDKYEFIPHLPYGKYIEKCPEYERISIHAVPTHWRIESNIGDKTDWAISNEAESG